MASVEHFEIPADDVARAKSFYGTVFGFTFEDWDDDNVMISTGSEKGIGGDIHKRSATPHPTVVITVDNLEETLAAITAAGGEQVGEIQALTETSRWVYFKDSEGNLIGAYDSTD